MRSGKTGIFDRILLRKIRVSKGNVAVDCIGEQQNVLGSYADVTAKLIKLQLTYINAIHQHTPLRHVVETRDKIDEACFT
ncbi:hypothetical protein D3C73_1119240 [compost metagenome]